MFAAHCTGHGTDVLLSEQRIVAMHRTATEHIVEFRCWCGTIGRFTEPVVRSDRGSGPDVALAADDELAGGQLA